MENGIANADASGSGSIAVALAVDGTGKAVASDGALADAEAGAACKATTTASGAGGKAAAQCLNPGSVVTAEATEGSIAIGSDTVAPTCTPKNGGTAKVTSPMGNCS